MYSVQLVVHCTSIWSHTKCICSEMLYAITSATISGCGGGGVVGEYEKFVHKIRSINFGTFSTCVCSVLVHYSHDGAI